VVCARPIRACNPATTRLGAKDRPRTIHWSGRRLIAGGAPEIAQARRLGHHLPNRVVEVYSHVAPEVETRLLADLQRRWHKAIRSPYPKGPRLTSAAKADRGRARQSNGLQSVWVSLSPLAGGTVLTAPAGSGGDVATEVRWVGAWCSRNAPAGSPRRRSQSITQDRALTRRNPSDLPERRDRRGSAREWS